MMKIYGGLGRWHGVVGGPLFYPGILVSFASVQVRHQQEDVRGLPEADPAGGPLRAARAAVRRRCSGHAVLLRYAPQNYLDIDF